MGTGKDWYLYVVVLLVAGAIYLGCIISPPSLMDDDDVNAVQAQISRTMLTSGDWVTFFSSIFFYTDRSALLRNGRFNHLEDGAYAPGALTCLSTILNSRISGLRRGGFAEESWRVLE